LKINIFKPYLQGKAGYKGGKTLAEIQTAANKIYKLSSNENPIGCSPLVIQAIQDSLQNLHHYPDRTAIHLQKALANFYKQELTENQFIATNSGSEALEHIIRAFLTENTSCIISNPCFFPYTMFSTWQGAKVIDVPLNEVDYSVNIQGILAAINDTTRLIFLTSPNNPTGSYIPQEKLDYLIDHLPEHVVLVLDEVYFHFADAPDYTSAMKYVKTNKKVIALNSFSKAFGMASLRCGYLYSTPQLASYIRSLSKPFLINKLSLNAAIAALKDTDFLNEIQELIIGERKRVQTELTKMGVKFWPSQGNFILIDPQTNSQTFTNQMLSEGIMVRPVDGFGAPGKIRVTLGTTEANDAYLGALKNVLSLMTKV